MVIYLKHLDRIFIILILFVITGSLKAQNAITSNSLYKEIAHMDSMLFNAFNNRDIETFKRCFAEDLEFFHDKGGLTDYNYTINSFKNTIAQNNGLRRDLVQGSLEVY